MKSKLIKESDMDVWKIYAGIRKKRYNYIRRIFDRLDTEIYLHYLAYHHGLATFKPKEWFRKYGNDLEKAKADLKYPDRILCYMIYVMVDRAHSSSYKSPLEWLKNELKMIYGDK